MFYQEYVGKGKEIQIRFLRYIEKQDNIEENYENLICFLSDKQFLKNKDDITIFLRLISRISQNHRRKQDFMDKINKILDYLKDNMLQYFSELEIYNIFKFNKLIILYLIESKVLNYSSIIILFNTERMKKYCYINFLQPENNDYIGDKTKISEEFYEKRRIGENDDYISELIRKDLIDKFISYVKQNDFPLNSKITPSIFETNTYLILNPPRLIQYAAFFGSVQVFKYLYKNGVQLTSSLWLYVIHSDDAEIMSILQDEHIFLQIKHINDVLRNQLNAIILMCQIT